MGKEIRRVPPNWEHARKRNGEYESLHDGFYYDKEARDWMINCMLWHEESIQTK